MAVALKTPDGSLGEHDLALDRRQFVKDVDLARARQRSEVEAPVTGADVAAIRGQRADANVNHLDAALPGKREEGAQTGHDDLDLAKIVGKLAVEDATPLRVKSQTVVGVGVEVLQIDEQQRGGARVDGARVELKASAVDVVPRSSGEGDRHRVSCRRSPARSMTKLGGGDRPAGQGFVDAKTNG